LVNVRLKPEIEKLICSATQYKKFYYYQKYRINQFRTIAMRNVRHQWIPYHKKTWSKSDEDLIEEVVGWDGEVEIHRNEKSSGQYGWSKLWDKKWTDRRRTNLVILPELHKSHPPELTSFQAGFDRVKQVKYHLYFMYDYFSTVSLKSVSLINHWKLQYDLLASK
jgi:hypothetical protein